MPDTRHSLTPATWRDTFVLLAIGFLPSLVGLGIVAFFALAIGRLP
jgi:hypothetical protein